MFSCLKSQFCRLDTLVTHIIHEIKMFCLDSVLWRTHEVQLFKASRIGCRATEPNPACFCERFNKLALCFAI